jgi:hypothetical protein
MKPSSNSQTIGLLESLIELERTIFQLEGYRYIEPLPGVSDAQIDKFERRFPAKFPPSYRQVLHAHDGVPKLWGDFSLIGIAGDYNAKAWKASRSMMEIDAEETTADLSSETAVRAYEARGSLVLNRHIVIGTDMSRGLLLYDTNTVDDHGEMEVVLYRADAFPHRRFKSLDAFLSFCIDEETSELDKLKARGPAVKPASKQVPATVKGKPAKKAPAKKKSASAKRAKKEG